MDLSFSGLSLILPVCSRSADNGNVGSIEVFMRRILDYAGMFPPANLPLEQAACNFQEYQRHPHADFLGAFIAPLFRWKDVGQADGLPAPASLLVRDTEIGPGLQIIDAASIEVILPAGSVR